MTKREAVEKHRILWNTIAKMIDDGVEYDVTTLYKMDAIIIMGDIGIKSDCYCCEYAKCKNPPWDVNCKKCPIVWKYEHCLDGEYGDFRQAVFHRDYPLAAEIAREIANLPEREDDE